MKKTLPFDKKFIDRLIKSYPTPFYIYDEMGIRNVARRLQKAFSWNYGFKEYFAVKATPNPAILQILKTEGCGTDCSSLAELLLSEKVGIIGEDVMFTSNDTPAIDFKVAKKLGAIINLDDISHIAFLEKHAGIPDIICFRYNPGPARVGNSIIGNPVEAKYGLTKNQLFKAYKIMRDKGVQRFGLHTMVASNELDPQYFIDTASMLFDLVGQLSAKLGINFELVNLGGGIGIPYRPGQKPVNLELVAREVKNIYQAKVVRKGLPPIKLAMECGRLITGPYGYLVSRVQHLKKTYKKYVGLDACMANLMRPGMYGNNAYHHITVLGKEEGQPSRVYDVTGSLCENNDKFAVDRKLPKIEIGDLVVLHDAGAHGHSMGFNYNGKLRSAELLLQPDGKVKLIRRAETVDDYFATLNF